MNRSIKILRYDTYLKRVEGKKLTGWSRSFMLALKAIVVGFVFAIIGVIIMAFGVGLFY